MKNYSHLDTHMCGCIDYDFPYESTELLLLEPQKEFGI